MWKIVFHTCLRIKPWYVWTWRVEKRLQPGCCQFGNWWALSTTSELTVCSGCSEVMRVWVHELILYALLYVLLLLDKPHVTTHSIYYMDLIAFLFIASFKLSTESFPVICLSAAAILKYSPRNPHQYIASHSLTDYQNLFLFCCLSLVGISVRCMPNSSAVDAEWCILWPHVW